MKIFPAIDIFDKKAVRLYKGDYKQMTVYSDNPVEIARDFFKQGAKQMHVVDLEGARDGNTPNFDIIRSLIAVEPYTEVGGGVRNLDTVKKYIEEAGASRVIIGTAAVTDRVFLEEALRLYGEKIAVGVDIKDGFVAIKGWTENSDFTAVSFCKELEQMGVSTVICTDISKDGAMKGPNVNLYKTLLQNVKMNVIASGGVSDLKDLIALKESGVYGAIVGKAYYSGAVSLSEAIEATK